MKIWFLAMRPKTWVATFAPCLSAYFLALKSPDHSFVLFLATLFSALSIQIGTNFYNDAIDSETNVDTDQRKGPLKAIVLGSISKRQMFMAAHTCFAISFALSLYLAYIGGVIYLYLCAISIALGYGYSHPLLALSYRGIAEPFSFLFFGPIASLGTYYLQTRSLSLEVLIVGCLCGFFSLIMLTLNNLRDCETDRLANKKTLCVRFGQNLGKWLVLSSLAFSYFGTGFLLFNSLCYLLLFLSLPFAFVFAKNLYLSSKESLVPLFFQGAKLYLTFSALLWICCLCQSFA